MPRSYSRNPEPHRDLFVSRDPQRGADVRALYAAADRRLGARDVERRLPTDGVLDDPGAFASLVTAARLLGAREDTLKRRDAKGRPLLTVGAQAMIRYPGRRTPEQLARAEERLGALIAEREKRARDRKDRGGGVSGLSPGKRSEARNRAVEAMGLLLRNEPRVHYTQGPLRWQGIAGRKRSAKGEFPSWCDCSSSTTWALWNALTGVGGDGFADIVNGSGWRAGYTGTQLAHGEPVDDLLPGDLVFYGRPGSTGSHVAMYVGAGRVISHGSERGPFSVPTRYRGDYMGARRYI